MPENKGKKFSEDTVISRARRMHRSEMRKVATALGLDGYDPETFQKKLEELKKAREEGMTTSDRAEKALQEMKQRNVELEAKLLSVSSDVARHKKDLTLAQRDRQKLETEYEIRQTASRAGLDDLDYGLHLLRGHIKNLPPEQQGLDDTAVKAFFEGLKKDPDKRHLFRDERVSAGPKTLEQQRTAQQPNANGQQTQIGQSGLPPQGAPPPAPAGSSGATKPADAIDMSRRDFRNHARERYGYSPGAP